MVFVFLREGISLLSFTVKKNHAKEERKKEEKPVIIPFVLVSITACVARFDLSGLKHSSPTGFVNSLDQYLQNLCVLSGQLIEFLSL